MASTPRLQVGTIFAEDYRIVGPLAEGGMGSVYRAEQISTAKPRAVKVVHGRLLDDERSRMRFVREATVAASIASEHVVEVIAAGIDRATELPYLVMELLEGGDLAAVVRHRGRLTTAELGAMLRQLCHGLSAAHAARVIHRDLKPENIFVAYPRHAGTSFTVKILDFGIAKVTQESKTVATLTGTVGSPLWMSPEQINNEALGPQTDVWALGLLAFWALTGQSYWRTARADRLTIQALFAEQLFRELEPASTRAAEFGMADAIGPGFDDWFMHCVSRRPSDRFSDAGPAWAAFEQAIDAGMRSDIKLLPPRGEVWESTSARISVAESTHPDAASASDRSSGGYGSGLGTTFGGVLTIASTNAELPTPPASDAIAPSGDVAAASTSVRRRQWMLPAAVAVGVTLALGGIGTLAWRYAIDPGRTDELREPLVQTEPKPEPQPEPKPKPEPPDPPPQKVIVPEIITPPPPDPPPKDDAQERAAVAVIRPMTTQPPFSAAAIEVLGWSTDRSRFVIETDYPTHPAADGLKNRVRLAEVHDALSGEMVGSFLLERDADASISDRDRYARLAAEAEPKDDWPLVRDELALVAKDPSGLPPEGLARVELSIKPVPSGSTITSEATAEGFAFEWTYGAPPAGVATSTPHLVLHWTSGAQRWEILDVPLSISPEELATLRHDTTTPVYTGTIALHWSPQAERILVVIHAHSKTADGAIVEPTHDVRWFLRASGPQIRLVDGGAGQRKLRHAAWALQRAGLPIAAADLDHEDVESSRAYVRARDPAAADLAAKIAEALGTELPSATLDRSGWTQIVVMLGPDFRDPAAQ